MTINKPDEKYMTETMDTRRFFLCLFNKIWIVILAVILGAIIGAGVYTLYYSITDGDTRYQISTDYYITFNEKEHPHGMDFYNAYTWGQFVTDDKIVDYILARTDSVTKDEIKSSVTSDMPSDYRVLKVKVTNTDIEKLNEISEQYKQAMPYFASELAELIKIEVWSCDEMQVVNIHNLTGNAAIAGAILMLILAGFSFAIYYCMDDRIYVEKDWNKLNNQIPFLGYDCEPYKADTDANAKALIKSDDVLWIHNIDEVSDEKEIVLQVPWGKKHSSAVEYDINNLNKRGIKVLGVVLTDCNSKFLKCYYGLK